MFEPLPDLPLERLRAVERAATWAFLAQCEALAALWDSTPSGSRVGRRPHVLAEAGLALGLHPQSVGGRLSVGLALRDLPLLRDLLAGGRLGVAHALVAVEEVGAYGDDDLAARVLRDVLANEGRLGWSGTPSELRRALSRAAVRLDPAAARRRREEQQAQRTGVRLRPQPDGLAAWVATGPAVQLQAADRLLDAASRPTGPDDRRTRGQRQVDALLGALVAQVGAAVPLELEVELPVRVDEARPVPQAGGPTLPEPVTISADLGPELLALLAGAASGRDDAVRPVPDRAAPAAARRAPRSEVPELQGAGAVDPGLLADLLGSVLPAGLGGLRLRRVCVDEHGQAVATDARSVPLARLPRGAAGLLARLTTALPVPPPPRPGYEPTEPQRRVVRARDRRCRFPGCGRRALQGDLDHRDPHPDGETTVANLHALCRHHHRLKHDGWRCTRSPDGTTTWTSPRGQRAEVRPP